MLVQLFDPIVGSEVRGIIPKPIQFQIRHLQTVGSDSDLQIGNLDPVLIITFMTIHGII